MTSREAVELFHLLFLRALTSRLEDKTLVALKGGANLRFFFQSVRYSEDVDFDVSVMAKGTLEKKVDDLLQAPVMVAPLRAQRLALVDASKPKQTETTQRWKVGIRVDPGGEVTRTRIEFSRRSAIYGAVLEATRGTVLSAYGLPPFLAMHYPVARAIAQKVHALYDRREPQPRDVFDLHHLFARSTPELGLSVDEKAWLPGAIDSAMSVSFDDYTAKVVAYLEPEHADLFGSRQTWELMQADVVDRLEALRK